MISIGWLEGPWFFAGAISQVTPSGGGSSQTPAVMALILAAISGAATVFSIYRQNRNDNVANRAVHSTAANEASEQSFKQLRDIAGYLGEENAHLKAEMKSLDERVEALEDDVAVERRENNRLRTMVIQLGGKP